MKKSRGETATINGFKSAVVSKAAVADDRRPLRCSPAANTCAASRAATSPWLDPSSPSRDQASNTATSTRGVGVSPAARVRMSRDAPATYSSTTARPTPAAAGAYRPRPRRRYAAPHTCISASVIYPDFPLNLNGFFGGGT